MKLTERYIYAVTKNLPASQRDEVAKELRSDIEDMIEHEKGAREVRERAALESLGDPVILAGQYATGKQYLVGPEWYAPYLITLKRTSYIAFPVVIVIRVLAQLMENPIPGIIPMLVDAIGGAIAVLIHVFFWVTLVFVVMERVDTNKTTSKKAWSVDALPQLPPERDVKLVDSICGIVAYTAMAIGVALTATLLGAKTTEGTTVPFFNPELWSWWLPVILALLVGLALKELAVIIKAKQTHTLVAVEVILNTVLTGVLVALYAAGLLINPDFVATAGAHIGTNVIETILLVSIVVLGVSYFIETVSTIVRHIKNSRA